MNKLNNKEFRLSITNLIAAEEHIIEMMCNTDDKEQRKLLFDELKNVKSQRNILLTDNNEDERNVEFNKWCLLKHLMLSEYHLIEWVNQSKREFEEAEKVFPTINSLEKIIEYISEEQIESNCRICPEDLIVPKMLKNFFKR